MKFIYFSAKTAKIYKIKPVQCFSYKLAHKLPKLFLFFVNAEKFLCRSACVRAQGFT